MISQLQKGQIFTIVGTGDPGYGGDGQDGRQAALNEPKNLCFDAEGNILIADSENHVIRRMTRTSGLVETVAGSISSTDLGSQSPSQKVLPNQMSEDVDPLADGEQIPGSEYTQTPDLSGTVRYIAGQGIGKERFSGDGGRATQALLNFPSAVAVDSRGVLFIADTLNHRIRQVDYNTGNIQTIAGTGQSKWNGDGGVGTAAALNEPVALVIDGIHLYIADQSNNRIRMLNLETHIITTVAGTGESGYNGDGIPAHEASLAGPSGLALDKEGNLYVGDTFNGRIRMIEQKTGMISTVVGDGSEFRYERGVNEKSQSLSRPYGIALTLHGNVLITDSDHHLVRQWNPQQKEMSLVAGNGQATFSGDGGLPEESGLSFPFGVAVDPWGNVAIADTFNHRIRYIPVA